MSVAILFCYGQDDAETGPPSGSPSRFNIKTNLLYDATASFSLGVETALGRKASLDVSGSYNPWTFGENRKWKHLLIQPELRFWTRERYRGFFWGPHAHYAFYNVGNLPHPPFSRNMEESRYEGWLAGAGLSAGYRLGLSGRVALEAVVGAGYAYLSYDKYECGHCGEFLYSGTRNYFGPTKAALSLVVNIGRGGQTALPAAAPFTPPAIEVPAAVPPVAPQYALSYTTPRAETAKQEAKETKTHLYFAVGASRIAEGFKDNASGLERIHEMIREVKGKPGAAISGITITGYASPDGSRQTNQSISEKRAAALKEIIKSVHGFDEALFSVTGKGEDWETLDSLVAASGLADKSRILEIIRSGDDADGKERKLKQLAGGAPYRKMLAGLFPELRRGDYQLHYMTAPFTVEKGKELLRDQPTALSLNELYLIAESYAPGSEPFNDLFETAAHLFPRDDNANLNAAAAALARKETISVGRYLAKVKEQTPAYHNNRGILLALQGDYDAAADAFRQAMAGGNKEAERNLEQIPRFRISDFGFRDSIIQ